MASEPRRLMFVEGNVDGTIGGSFFSLLFLVAGLDRGRFHATVVFAAENPLIPRFRAAGAEVVVIRPTAPYIAPSSLLRPVAKAVNFVRGFHGEPRRLARELKQRRIDLVHLNNSIIRNHAWMVAARRAGIPCITHERGINAAFPARAHYLGRRLDAVICISQAVRDNFQSLGLGDLRMHTILNGLDPGEMKVRQPADEIRAEFGLTPGRRVIGMVGTIRYWKGQDVLVRAVAALRERFPDIACLLIGTASPDDGSYERQVKAQIAELGLERHVIITGYRSNVADYVNALEIQVHSSTLPEPFGRVLLEAMALRKPLVASRGGAVPEIVDEGVTGLMFTPSDHADLARGLQELLIAPERARAMGEAGYRRLVERFGIDRNVAETQKLYESLLG